MELFNDVGILKTPAAGATAENILKFPATKGYVEIDVPELIDNVVVSPLSPDWFSDLVVSVSKKLGYEFEVIPSQMSRPSALWQA
jgi:hypothetical protein